MTDDARLAQRADEIMQDYAEEGRCIGKWAAYQMAEQDDDIPPDVAGMCDADAWNVLDRWLTERKPPPEMRETVEREMDEIIARIQNDCAQLAADAEVSRTLIRERSTP